VILEPKEHSSADDDGADDDREDMHTSEPLASATPAAPKKKKGGGSATMLGAAMLAIGDIFEPEKTTVEIIQTDDDPIDDPPFDLNFGDLPPLD
jgi:hypothetical protein